MAEIKPFCTQGVVIKWKLLLALVPLILIIKEYSSKEQLQFQLSHPSFPQQSCWRDKALSA